jgi:hypothetical protein
MTDELICLLLEGRDSKFIEEAVTSDTMLR